MKPCTLPVTGSSATSTPRRPTRDARQESAPNSEPGFKYGRTAMASGNATDQPWEGGISVPVLPPHVPLFDSAAIVVAQQSDAQAGVAVSYSRGIFTRQSWSTGHPVPGLIEVLKPQEVKQVRDQVLEQLVIPGDGLDHLPLRAFVTAADVYLNPEPSTRFDRAVFGTIAEQAPGQLLGAVAYPGDVAGTVLGSDAGVSESHIWAASLGLPGAVAGRRPAIADLKPGERAGCRRHRSTVAANADLRAAGSRIAAARNLL